MKLLDFLSYECVLAELAAHNKEDVLTELANVVTQAHHSINKIELVSILKEREKVGSTGIGNGVAIPHGKYQGISSLVAAFGRSPSGIDFNALDGHKVHFFCLLVAPQDSVGDHLKALACISRLFKKEDFRDKLSRAPSKDEIWSILSAVDKAT
ncbi:PTS sugar transporter subunit IIA [candidate division CSSED10-310 bacterium]|uniref:PTS sugar transporter subunit IIA n=1 Tax=candidate division CSSED10-310 bacterium TaxID=2855610 RepID=A0ABV6Z2W8_UNCC1